MPKIKLVANVAEIGLFRSLARTRARLVSAALVSVGATYAAGLWAAGYMFDTSKSVILNMFIITALMMMLLVASYLVTLLIGDLFFPGPWREQVILGREPAGETISVDDHSAEFMIVLILTVVANAFALNWTADGFLDRYHDEGFFAVRLRSDDADERLAALKNIIEPINYELWDLPALQQIVVGAFDDPSPKVRQFAYWTAGKMKDTDAQPKLLAVLRSSASAEDKKAAAIALGKIGEPQASREALEALARGAHEPGAKVGALRGLGLLASAKSVDTILPLTHSPNEQVRIHAFWALRKIGSKKARPLVKKVIAAHPHGVERCAAYDTLKLVANKDDVLWARRQFQRFDSGQEKGNDECKHIVWTEPDKTQHYIVYGNSYREKLIKIVANADASHHRQWFQRLINDPAEPFRIRQVANEVLRQLKEAQ